MKKFLYKSIFIILILAVMLCSCNKNFAICGLWKNESDGIYLQLRSDDSGTLGISGAKPMEFNYEISDGKLILDFTEESVKNAEYSYTLDGDTLTLISENSEISLSRLAVE